MRHIPSSFASPETAAGVPQTPAAVRVPAPWLVWLALGIVYVVWGSTYLGIRVVVETMPPMLGAAARFLTAGALLLAFLAARRGAAAVRPTRAQLAAALLVGTLLMGANAVISVAELHVPSGLAALIVASVPLWVILLRAADRRPARARDRRRRGGRLRRRRAAAAPGRAERRRDASSAC